MADDPLTPAAMGRRGALKRWASVSPAERSAHGRRLARARWDRLKPAPEAKRPRRRQAKPEAAGGAR